MKSLRLNIFSKNNILYLVLFIFLTLFYLSIRVYFVKTLPIFTDEAIYARWAQIGFYDPSARLASLSDGKQPLFIWFSSLVMNIIPNPLYASRIVSLAFGYFTMVSICFVMWLFFRNIALSFYVMALYVFYPFSVLHDSMALYDTSLAFFYLISSYVFVRFITQPSLGLVFVYANIMAGALLTKSTSILFYAVIPISFVLKEYWKKNHNFTLIITYILLSIAISQFYQSVLYLSPNASQVAIKNNEFLYPASLLLTLRGIRIILVNFIEHVQWIISYVSIPIIVACLYGIIRKKIFDTRLAFLTLLFFVPFVFISSVGKIVFPRHILFTTIPLLLVIGYILWNLASECKILYVRIALLLITLLPFIFTNIQIVYNLRYASIPEIDKYQYFTGWPAGGGMKEIISFMLQHSSNAPMTIAAEGSYGGLPRLASEIYFAFRPNISIISFDDPGTKIPLEIITAAKNQKVYIIFNKTQKIPSWPMEKILEIKKSYGNNSMRLYSFGPNP